MFVAQHPCVFCDRRPGDAHHLRFAQSRALGRKVSDEYIVPFFEDTIARSIAAAHPLASQDNVPVDVAESGDGRTHRKTNSVKDGHGVA